MIDGKPGLTLRPLPHHRRPRADAPGCRKAAAARWSCTQPSLVQPALRERASIKFTTLSPIDVAPPGAAPKSLSFPIPSHHFRHRTTVMQTKMFTISGNNNHLVQLLRRLTWEPRLRNDIVNRQAREGAFPVRHRHRSIRGGLMRALRCTPAAAVPGKVSSTRLATRYFLCPAPWARTEDDPVRHRIIVGHQASNEFARPHPQRVGPNQIAIRRDAARPFSNCEMKV